jgi:hypothetical protein
MSDFAGKKDGKSEIFDKLEMLEIDKSGNFSRLGA